METKAERDKRMEWWREARLGMFIHWGLYSIPAGQYGGKTGYGEWIREEAHIPVGEYEKYKDQFNPVNFDADAWVKMARDAGMKYITITTKHHDGFNLFDSPLTDWNVMHTPSKRDIMAEMAAACKKYGVTMCWYHSIMDWHHPDYLPRRTWEVNDRPADGADFRRFVKYLRDEVSWLLTHYGPIGVMWFDGEWESTWNPKDGDELYALCRQLQPNVIVNNRVTVGRSGMEDSDSIQAGDYTTPEQYIPPTGLPGVDWETCMTMNDHWGYNSHDANWKSSSELIHNIVDIASKGGNYLLNVGPRADGSFPPEAVERLHDIGTWMRTNGSSIYGTTASVFEQLPWGRSTTRRDGGRTVLYLHVFDWPADGRLVVPGIGNDAIAAAPAGRNAALTIRRLGSDLVILVPRKAPDPVCSVIALTIKGAPVVYRAPKIDAAADMVVGSLPVSIAAAPGLSVRYTLDGSEPSARSPIYAKPLAVSSTVTLRAAAFDKGKRVSNVVSRTFTVTEPWPRAARQAANRGLWCEEFAGDWDVLPDFSRMKNRASFGSAKIGPAENAGKMEERVGRRYTGQLLVPRSGVYAFALTADDGAKLWVDGKPIVDNDGLHGAVTKTGSAPLAAGPHAIEIRWFNKSGNAALAVDWALAGEKLRPIKPEELAFDEG